MLDFCDSVLLGRAESQKDPLPNIPLMVRAEGCSRRLGFTLFRPAKVILVRLILLPNQYSVIHRHFDVLHEGQLMCFRQAFQIYHVTDAT